jgi:hypothetical protein
MYLRIILARDITLNVVDCGCGCGLDVDMPEIYRCGLDKLIYPIQSNPYGALRLDGILWVAAYT